MLSSTECVDFRFSVYLCFIKQGNQLCVGNTGHLAAHK